jgi:hypothetical protein
MESIKMTPDKILAILFLFDNLDLPPAGAGSNNAWVRHYLYLVKWESYPFFICNCSGR